MFEKYRHVEGRGIRLKSSRTHRKMVVRMPRPYVLMSHQQLFRHPLRQATRKSLTILQYCQSAKSAYQAAEQVQ